MAILGYGLPMTTDSTQTLQALNDFCDRKWLEASQATADWPTPDMLTGKKMAFNEVIQEIRLMLAALESAA